MAVAARMPRARAKKTRARLPADGPADEVGVGVVAEAGLDGCVDGVESAGGWWIRRL